MMVRPPQAANESQIVRRAADGDVEAFTELVVRYQNLAYGYAWSILGDAHASQDATQEAFLAAFRNLRSLNDPGAFPGWLRGIVRHCCGRQLRRRDSIDGFPLDAAQHVTSPAPSPLQSAE